MDLRILVPASIQRWRHNILESEGDFDPALRGLLGGSRTVHQVSVRLEDALQIGDEPLVVVNYENTRLLLGAVRLH